MGIFSKLEATWGVKKEFRLKIFFLSLAFAMLTACQAIWRPIKTAVFISIVGVKYIPDAKFYLIFPLIFLIFLYSKLVDWLRRHHLFYAFALSHAAVGLILYFFLSHEVYGIPNSAQDPSRIFGWVFYFFMESFGAFMSAAFWSFANSINKPKDARKYYSLLVVGSKLGGITAGLAIYFVSSHIAPTQTTLIPNILLIGCGLLLGAAGSIYLLMKYVPGYLMHGYEAVYQYEKKLEKETGKSTKSVMMSLKEGIEGLILLFKKPYVFGIFSMILSYQIIIVIVDYLVALAASKVHTTPNGLVCFFTLSTTSMHIIGILIAFFGTAPIQRFLGIRLSLFISPLATLTILPLIFFYPTPYVLLLCAVVLRALNYGLNHPTQEALFIPTTKAIKFKAKAWTDAFGSRISKASGSLLNKHVLFGLTKPSSILGAVIAFGWLTAAYFLGKTYNAVITENKIVGAEDENM